MTDIMDSKRRSELMAGIRSCNTTPELAVRRIAHRMGLRFRLHRKDLPGRPDLVFPKHRLVVFVHGCFWHRHEGCRHASIPKSRTDFWMTKLAANVARDRRQEAALQALGWQVLVIWGCETGDSMAVERRLAALTRSSGPLLKQESTPSVTIREDQASS
ncbi:MAG: DNA mismatch endonuclease Vsr [Synechococcus sp. SB0668_bin_15]|nr:DNA mismatch endonuclease Vsr [Synechococcus sp. SB0668_bin_15]MXZ83122.1 DNA mismatch endonuclease Vsr [Synechococcus sp. SB0666_bin_14]MYA91044.1 DNA mismatch endonuclease Vsr [Synechococcus sp. SB0663_bin_10]MYC50469.1 DNA mismatch endonuclease Vsr [Synechococcus sp. SB0662_bin_14]MYG46146.1 DNA mismatch endonuclease Vsr [Synechococcus sp. SB0675_bin_6]MYJ59292.1 DNA mismatch endonuclease Vsr [Synechococcus sp. SB0672_bin_6]MYK90934.1 DNA mismatch endonuclease Vsr [Synechococcus sp. SB0